MCNTKYERWKAVTSDNKLTKDTPYLTRIEFFGEKTAISTVHCVGEKDFEILTKIKLQQIKRRTFMCCCAPDEASDMHKLGTVSRLAIIATDALAPRVTKPSTAMKAYSIYRKVSNIRRTLVGNKIVNHSDVVEASPVGAALTASSFST